MTKLVTLNAPGRKMIFQDCKANGLQLSEKETWDLSRDGCVAGQMILSSQPEQREDSANWRPKPEKSIWKILEFLTALDMKPDPSTKVKGISMKLNSVIKLKNVPAAFAIQNLQANSW